MLFVKETGKNSEMLEIFPSGIQGHKQKELCH